MSDGTAIEWADATWNPLKISTHRWYCEKISPGCDNCYASTFNRRMGGEQYPTVRQAAVAVPLPVFPSLDERTLAQVATWKKPRRVFVCSMTDLFGEWVTFPEINRIFEAMLATPQHQYLVLTKRPRMMLDFLENRRDWLAHTGLATASWLTSSAWAESVWPNKPLRWLVTGGGRGIGAAIATCADTLNHRGARLADVAIFIGNDARSLRIGDDLQQQAHHFRPGGFVQVARRFISQNNSRILHQSPRNRNALLLPPG